MPPSNLAAIRGWRRLLLAALLIAGLALTAATAQPAHAVVLGMSDSDANTVLEPFWPGLGMANVRVVVPYDVVTATGDAGRRRRTIFEGSRENAAARGAALFVVFGPSADIRNGDGTAVAPSLDEFTAGVAAFMQRYPEIKTYGAWNEPNNPEADQYPLSFDPALAAAYWLRTSALCPSCTVVAGEFAGIAGDDAYVNAYQASLGGAIPPVWGFHAHGDVNSFQADGPDSARVTRYYLSKLQGPYAGSRIWIDEVGARYRDAGGFVWGDASQARATQFLLGLGTLDPRIDQLYYYNYSNQCSEPRLCATQDRGLVSPIPFDGQAPDYDAVNRPRAAWQVVANRGPVIQPAAAVPPVVTIVAPAQSAALNTPAPAFSGQAAVGGRAEPLVTLQVFPGAAASESSAPQQTLTAPVVAGAWSLRTAPLADGTYTAEAAQVGNPSSAGFSEPVVFTIDTVKPTSTFSSGPRPLTGARTATLAFAASEVGTTFVCSVDRAPSAPCVSPLKLSGLTVGRHAVSIRATDAAGNIQSRVTTFRWRVVSLASALVPRTGDLDVAASRGLPLAASCADGCRIGARLYLTRQAAADAGIAGRGVSRFDPARPNGNGRGYVVVGGAVAVRRTAGNATLALRLRPSSAPLLRRARAVTLRLAFELTAQDAEPVVVSRLVTLTRAGTLRGLAARGLPVTVACSSACTQRTTLYATDATARFLRATGGSVTGSARLALPRGRYRVLGSASVARTRGGATDVALAVSPRLDRRLRRLPATAVRVTGRALGLGTPSRIVGWPLLLPR